MNNTQRKAQELTKLGFKKGEHFRMRKGGVEWNLSSMTREQHAMWYRRYLPTLECHQY